jgi:hypothetical protein
MVARVGGVRLRQAAVACQSSRSDAAANSPPTRKKATPDPAFAVFSTVIAHFAGELELGNVTVG